MLGPWEGAASWLAPHSLFSLPSYRTQDHQPGMALPTITWTLPHNQKFKQWSTGLPIAQSYGDTSN